MAFARVVSFEGVTSERIDEMQREMQSSDRPDDVPAKEILVLHDPEGAEVGRRSLLRHRGRLCARRRHAERDAGERHPRPTDICREIQRRVPDDGLARREARDRPTRPVCESAGLQDPRRPPAGHTIRDGGSHGWTSGSCLRRTRRDPDARQDPRRRRQDGRQHRSPLDARARVEVVRVHQADRRDGELPGAACRRRAVRQDACDPRRRRRGRHRPR